MAGEAAAGGTLEDRVLLALEEIRPGLRSDGGDVTFVALEGEVVKIRLEGACAACSMAPTTLVSFITERVRHHAPEIVVVVAV